MNSESSLAGALDGLRQMLAADGYLLELLDGHGKALTAAIIAGPEACADCLVPKTLMRAHFEKALQPSFGTEPPDIHLIYPADIARINQIGRT